MLGTLTTGYSTGYIRNDLNDKKTVRSHSTTEIAPTPLSFSIDGRRSAIERTVTPVSFLRNESAGPASSKSRLSRRALTGLSFIWREGRSILFGSTNLGNLMVSKLKAN
ncbi:hypothetical protein HELRODRAFT_175896 [Helobdella robusta]|uniref:Uncharacterized protein n=1 Tax=Helobdella robusta TaxID=6412 RepID=T1F9U7_HELRO|nr:hypothetical protein HELRODRAFT_175896 [Helobdella robusta]ESO00461.1 hypothetical protein HELRODRAFT_175896 [Helobdella robusta]